MMELNNPNKEMDCTKITSLEEVKLILDSLELFMKEDCPHYDKLKHLLK
tara:strand:+ start:180 stop:326 length:147 start_codon:yes stop_codon:yes gene_type:complete